MKTGTRTRTKDIIKDVVLLYYLYTVSVVLIFYYYQTIGADNKVHLVNKIKI